MKLKSLLFNKAISDKIIRFFTNKWWWLLIIILIGSYFRFANVYNRFALPTDIGGDMEYYHMGEGLSKNGALRDPLTGEVTACRSIMYPGFIALINTLNPESTMGNVRVAQAVLGVLAILMIYFLGALVHSRVCGLIAAFLFAVNPIMIERVSWLWIESFYYFIVLGVAIWMTIWRCNPNLRNTVLFGLGIGISLMCRSSLFFLPFVLGGIYYFKSKEPGYIKKNIWFLLLFSYVLLLPWVARNAYHFKEFIPFERNAAVEDIYSASLGEIADQLDGPIVKIVIQENSDRIYKEMISVSINNILERPVRYISSYFLRFSFIMGELQFLGILGEGSVLFYIFLLWGVFVALRSRKAAPLVLLLMYFIGIHIFMAVRLRHMFVIIPLFCVLVALGIASLIQKLGFLWRKKLLIESGENLYVEIMKKAGAIGPFSLFALFYLFSLFFIARELWICAAAKSPAFAESASISKITDNNVYKLETQQPIVHLVENYVHESGMAFLNIDRKPVKKSIISNKKYDSTTRLSQRRQLSRVHSVESDRFGGDIFISSNDSHGDFQRAKIIAEPSRSSFMSKRDIDNRGSCVMSDKCSKLSGRQFGQYVDGYNRNDGEFLSSMILPAKAINMEGNSEGSEANLSSLPPAKHEEMVLISAGKFQMGSRFWSGKFDEHPRREIYLDAFFIDKYEVTANNYNKCVIIGKCKEPPMKDIKSNCNKKGRGEHPVNYVDWYQAKAYCEWIGKRLPTEAEWEKAARGTSGKKYPWGNERASCEYAIIDNSEDEGNRSVLSLYRHLQHKTLKGSGCGLDSTWPVGSRPKGISPYGVMDMIGNVTEWVSDWYNENYYEEGVNKNPGGPPNGKYRVARGHSLQNYIGSIRSAYRFKYLPVYKSEQLGFRCATDGKD